MQLVTGLSYLKLGLKIIHSAGKISSKCEVNNLCLIIYAHIKFFLIRQEIEMIQSPAYGRVEQVGVLPAVSNV